MVTLVIWLIISQQWMLHVCVRRCRYHTHFQCKLGSETASMSSISSTDESFRWHGHHGHPLHQPTHQALPSKYTHGRQPSHQSVDGSTYNHGQQASLDGSSSIPAPSMSSSHSLTGPAIGPLGLGPPQHEELESDAESKMSGSQLVDSCL